MAHIRIRSALRAGLLWLALALACLTAQAAEPGRVGEVLEVSGVASAQRETVPARFLAKGEPLFEGDVVTTSSTGYAQLEFLDGTKLTLRPDTRFAVDRLRHGEGEESAAFRLLKGGVRTLTGLISKRNPEGAEIRTSTATIGIRGTSFDARLCDKDCAEEEAKAARGAGAAADESIVARVGVLEGGATATGRDGQTRTLTQGAALIDGDTVTTAPKSHAVLVFRDETRVTIAPDSIFRLEDVRFTGPKAESGSYFVRVVKGSVRTLTGLLGKNDPKSVGIRVGNATIGVRGTGVDTGLVAAGPAPAAAENVLVHAWLDAVTMQAGDQSITIGQGQTGTFQPATNLLTLFDVPKPFVNDAMVPRPDQIKRDLGNLFSRAAQTVAPGLYVSVRNGDVRLTAIGGTIIPIGQGEVGFLAVGSTTPVRIGMPQFILNDGFPLPETGVRSLIIPLTPRPGSLICEIR